MDFLRKLWVKASQQIADLVPANTGTEQHDVNTNAPIINEYDEIQPPNTEFDTTELLRAYQENEATCYDTDTILANLRVLKVLVDAPKEEAPDLRFSKINEHLGLPESHETLRQERWQPNIYCPNCKSNNLKRLAQVPPQPAHNYKYECLDCNTVFNDDSGTPLATGFPPLHIWMQCWYLMGCTDSVSYIASKLNLDFTIVDKMIKQLQKTFSSKQPLSKFKGYAQNAEQIANLQAQLRDDLLKEYERLNANIATVPKDSAEFRKQQELRRTGKLNPTERNKI